MRNPSQTTTQQQQQLAQLDRISKQLEETAAINRRTLALLGKEQKQ